MSNESEKKLTLNDPVDPETLRRLETVHSTRQQIAMQLLEMEEERVRLLVAARPLRDERNRIFEKILIERGLPPTLAIDIDLETGRLFPTAPQSRPEK